MATTAARIEPGIFGVFDPVLLLPNGIATRLTPAQLQGVLAHELAHARRKDNLTAAIHMLVEAIFWFHPLVWWIGARMVDERERACDEEVLQVGEEAQAYAESIVKICEYYLESPLSCVSGITGADLKDRIQRIMSNRSGQALSLQKKGLLLIAAGVSVTIPLMAGAFTASRIQSLPSENSPTSPSRRPEFDVASIKRSAPAPPNGLIGIMPQPGGRFIASNVPLTFLIQNAYQLKGAEQISGAPDWTGWAGERFNIEATVQGVSSTLSPEQWSPMLQSLLTDRFKLIAHYETRQLPVYALRLSKPGQLGPQLRAHTDDAECAPKADSSRGGIAPIRCGGFFNRLSPEGWPTISGNRVTLDLFAAALSAPMVGLDRLVIDHTEMSGTFDVSLQFAPAPSPNVQSSEEAAGPPMLPTALEQQLGLKLERETGPVDVLVIDHVEQPTPN